MVAEAIHNTITDKDATRKKIYKEGTTTAVDYSDGSTVVLEKSGEGIPGRMREVREVRRVFSPKVRVAIPWRPGQYEKVFGHE